MKSLPPILFIILLTITVISQSLATKFKNDLHKKESIDINAKKFINAAQILDSKQKRAINQFVTDLKAINAIEPDFVNFDDLSTSKMKAIYLFVGGTTNSIKFNLLDPRDSDSSYRLTFHGTFIVDTTGIKGDGNSYLNTHLIPKKTLIPSDFSFSFYSPENDPDSSFDLGSSGSAIVGAILSHNGGIFYNWAKDYMMPVLESRNDGYYIFNRSDISNSYYLKNGFVRNSSISPSLQSELPSVPFLILGIQNNYSTRKCSFVSIGKGISMDAAIKLNDAVNKFQTALGRNTFYSIPPFSMEAKAETRIKKNIEGWDSSIYYTIQFPKNYNSSTTYSVIISYPGNAFEGISGYPDDARFGRGIAGDMPVLTIVIPFLDHTGSSMQATWWGDGLDDISSTLAFTYAVIENLKRSYLIDTTKILAAGFSRGAIALGKILCSDDTIVKKFKAFIAHSFMDGCDFTHEGADIRLQRSKGKTWSISWGGGPGDLEGKNGSLAGLSIIQANKIYEQHFEIPDIPHSDFFSLDKNGEEIEAIRNLIKELIESPNIK